MVHTKKLDHKIITSKKSSVRKHHQDDVLLARRRGVFGMALIFLAVLMLVLVI
jgi:hypothetical protein